MEDGQWKKIYLCNSSPSPILWEFEQLTHCQSDPELYKFYFRSSRQRSCNSEYNITTMFIQLRFCIMGVFRILWNVQFIWYLENLAIPKWVRSLCTDRYSGFHGQPYPPNIQWLLNGYCIAHPMFYRKIAFLEWSTFYRHFQQFCKTERVGIPLANRGSTVLWFRNAVRW